MGPWKLKKESHVITVKDVHGAVVAKIFCQYKNMEANARRIVACVNTCEGIETDTLESDRVREIIKRYWRIAARELK